MSAKTDAVSRPTPFINVTPLIDVLLVLLIIFMVVSPLKSARFSAQVPSQRYPDDPPLPPHIWTLLVTVDADHKLMLNALNEDLGTIEDTSKLSTKLAAIFSERIKHHSWRYEMLNRTDLPDNARIEKTVFIKAPRSMDYGLVVKVIDGMKGAGADPIGLQLDDLN